MWLGDGTALCDRFAPGFTLLRLDANRAVDDLLSAAAERSVPITVVDLDETSVRERYKAELVLIAPDGHVAWRGNEPPADCAALIDRIRGA